MIGPKGYFGKNCDTQTPQCPTYDDPQFALVDNKCVYFEKISLTYDKAIENCQEKLKDYGGGILYEPYSIEEQKRIVDMAYERGSMSWYFIGVTDKTTEGQYTYNSNNQSINFSPDWYSGWGSKGPSYNCIMILVKAPGEMFYAKWIDNSCTTAMSSICWSISE